MKELEVWHFLKESILNKLSPVLLLVAESTGSSPGRQGFKMAVNNTGEMVGSIGGGTMEYKFVEAAKDLEAQKINSTACKRQVHRKNDPEHSGMVCSGEQINITCLLNAIDADTINRIIAAIETDAIGVMKISNDGISFQASKQNNEDFTLHFIDENNWFYEENIGLKHTLSIIGGGHVGLAMSDFFRKLDFRVIVYDNRPHCKTVLENDHAHKKIISSYSKLGSQIAAMKNHYVVVMTFSMPHDVEALKSIIHYNFTYLGVMGSETKIDKIKAQLLDYGIEQKN
jgi:xanthine dehydrogenase accessory factor